MPGEVRASRHEKENRDRSPSTCHWNIGTRCLHDAQHDAAWFQHSRRAHADGEGTGHHDSRASYSIALQDDEEPGYSYSRSDPRGNGNIGQTTAPPAMPTTAAVTP